MTIRKAPRRQLTMNMYLGSRNGSATRIFKAIDLFAGIGGIRLGFEATGAVEVIFSSEIDKYACQTYYANFGDDAMCDITKIDEMHLPDFDILLAGFPCQAFSIAGRKGGFEDTRGTLFFDVARILNAKRPMAFFLENVKGLVQHDKGNTFRTIMRVLQKDLGYTVYAKLINAKDFGLPQKRERIYIVGFRDKITFDFPEPDIGRQAPCLKDVLESKEVSPKYYLSDTYLNTLVRHKKRHERKGNGFGFRVLDPEKEIANTLVVGGMGRERNLIVDKRLRDFKPVTPIKGKINDRYVRRLTPREWARLQGFPESFKIPVSDTQAYKQFGNSVCVPVVEAIAKKMIEALGRAKGSHG